MTLEIPDRVLEHTHWTAQELLVEFAVWLYEGERMSLARAAEAAGLDRISFQKMLAGRDIPTVYDGVDDWRREFREMREDGLL